MHKCGHLCVGTCICLNVCICVCMHVGICFYECTLYIFVLAAVMNEILTPIKVTIHVLHAEDIRLAFPKQGKGS